MSGPRQRRAGLAETRAARMDRPEAIEAYEQTRLRFELAETVRLRREELGWSQRQLAERAGMTSRASHALRLAAPLRPSRCWNAWPMRLGFA